MSLMFPDIVSITPITKDATYGNTIEGTTVTGVKAYAEASDTLRRGSSGETLQPIRAILIEKTATIHIGDIVTITTFRGSVPTTDDAIRRQVIKVMRAGAMGISHYEIETSRARG